MKKRAETIRHRIMDVMSKNGGHLASNLGTVELTIALHEVFNSPTDKFIFDVSHQAYTHKILTGRDDRFDTIRQHKGLSGFTDPKESEHDHFYAGHAGTALSLALGCAKERDLLGRDEYIIPILGDAALTCGLTFEALNNIPHDLKHFVIVLNDNAMSISQNVGAITHILRDHPEQFFAQFGLHYIGEVDGHDIDALLKASDRVKEIEGPVLLHVRTVKGQGMEEAIKSPTTYHGAKPFDRETGKFYPEATTNPTFPKVFGNHILKMAMQDPSIVTVTPAMPAGSCLTQMMKALPDRCLDVGIAEGHAITFAGALASERTLKVVVSIYSTFLQRGLDNLFQDVCLQESPVVFAIDRGGIAGGDGVTHNGIYDIGFLSSMPNMVIAQPRNGHLLCELMESAFSWDRPTAIRYPNLRTEEPLSPLSHRPLGKGEVLMQGETLAIIALGHMCQTALEVASRLKSLGIQPTVIDPIFVKPLDEALLADLLCSHKHLVTIEEHALQTGLASHIASFTARQGLDISMRSYGVPDLYVQHGSHSALSQELGLDAESITRDICEHFSYTDHNKGLCSNKMDNLTAPNQSKIDDRKWGSIP